MQTYETATNYEMPYFLEFHWLKGMVALLVHEYIVHLGHKVEQFQSNIFFLNKPMQCLKHANLINLPLQMRLLVRFV